MKKLPKIYRSEEWSPKDNNQKYCSVDNQKKSHNIGDDLDSIFNSFSNLYREKLEIVTKDKTYHTYLVSRTKNYVMTMDKEIIPIKEIIEIKR